MTQTPVRGQPEPQQMSILERMLQQRAMQDAQREQLGGGVGALLDALGINPLGFIQNLTQAIPGGQELLGGGTGAGAQATEDPYAFDPRGPAGGKLEDTLALMGIMRPKAQMNPLAQLAGNIEMPQVRPGTISASGKTPNWGFSYDEPEMGAAQAADLEDRMRRRLLADIIGGRVVAPGDVSMPEEDPVAQFGRARSLLEQLIGGGAAAPTTTGSASMPTPAPVSASANEDEDAAAIAAAVPRAGSSTRNQQQRRRTGIRNPLASLTRPMVGF